MKNKKGITLIALVITIIVLLILAGVSISLILGNNGVLTQATGAVNKNLEAQAEEDITMAWTSATSEYWSDWATDSSKTLSQYLTKDKLNKYLTGKGEISEELTLNNDVYTVTYELDKNGDKHMYSIQINQNGSILSINAVNQKNEVGQNQEENNNEEEYNFCCFDAGSKVLMADGTTKNIEDVEIGDLVMSLKEETGEFIPQQVTNVIIKHNSDDLVFINLSNGIRIGMRAYHPILTEEGWKSLRPDVAETIMDVGYKVQLLKEGDMLIGYGENTKIDSIEKRPLIDNFDTYNLSVEECHNYILNGIVVHNVHSGGCN